MVLVQIYFFVCAGDLTGGGILPEGPAFYEGLGLIIYDPEIIITVVVIDPVVDRIGDV